MHYSIFIFSTQYLKITEKLATTLFCVSMRKLGKNWHLPCLKKLYLPNLVHIPYQFQYSMDNLELYFELPQFPV